VRQLLAKHAATATVDCPSLKTKHVSPHALRHTNAMLLRAKDVDIATIALWLGHESIKTTRIYEHADPALKEQAIARIAPFGPNPADTDQPTRCSRSCRVGLAPCGARPP
jgi:integrase